MILIEIFLGLKINSNHQKEKKHRHTLCFIERLRVFHQNRNNE